MKKTIGVIASGPSCTQEDAKKLNAAVECIAVNDSYRLAPTAHLYAADYHWWRHHIASVDRDYRGLRWTQSYAWLNDSDKPVDPAQWGITALQGEQRPGLSREQGTIHLGYCSGYQAVNLAYLLGAERIVLLGFDMGMDGGKRHWFGDHPGALNGDSDYSRMIRCFESISPRDYGIEVINCSRRTALKCFPVGNLDEFLTGLDR